ncbi:TetR/AcrR family transcriptional regulator [Cellulomonas fengjieae]|uniref:TetR/AcrR family transcriptional regulator n=1 Tax=Cellulomonas fengjieae TaxID=2819978 RepID=A0ABS3SHA8_9CELL|nr:TetR/AcrR family transcriptional regulator [Cellulomonas fengjieae]MBO3085135.1 TetR/AcrR family transcriptional regulator [Cellulomonas fengjieae]MBO3100881.1 TetR/AcrR family transcriptional regulator [Cellulomonas fengjieae]QVI66287.1 TetR/AcrR family transcriptional regulator [Cellulomonas fengjieae]
MTSQDDGARVDPRVLRTRRLLQDALLALARERSLDEISVADVADRATVNRSTFYQHYTDTDTLLSDALDAQAALVGADLSTIHPSLVSGETPEVLVRYATHVADNLALYRSVLGEHGSPVAVSRLRRRIGALALEGLERHGAPPALAAIPRPIAAAAIAGSVIGVFVAWLERDPLPPPQEVADWAWSAVAGWPTQG